MYYKQIYMPYFAIGTVIWRPSLISPSGGESPNFFKVYPSLYFSAYFRHLKSTLKLWYRIWSWTQWSLNMYPGQKWPGLQLTSENLFFIPTTYQIFCLVWLCIILVGNNKYEEYMRGHGWIAMMFANGGAMKSVSGQKWPSLQLEG